MSDLTHIQIGENLEVFKNSTRGFPILLENGIRIKESLIKYIREINSSLGYSEISTPAIMQGEFLEKAGFKDFYAEDLYDIEGKNETLKPMNCPGLLQYLKESGVISESSLPIRISEFGFVYRKEDGKKTEGLLRLRAFTQDDGHVILKEEQIASEVERTLKAMIALYSSFNFKNLEFVLSTRPKESLGTAEEWEKAEAFLKQCMENMNIEYREKEQDGAFYGPKICVRVQQEAKQKYWQCGTVQLDYQMPKAIGLTYEDENKEQKTPVMIHRAILGSIERFIGVLLETNKGNFETWLSPVKVRMLPTTEQEIEIAQNLARSLLEENIISEIDFDIQEKIEDRANKALSKKIPYIITSMDKENATVVNRDGCKKSIITQEAFSKKLKKEISSRSNELTI